MKPGICLQKAGLLFGRMNEPADTWKLNMDYWDWNAGVALYAIARLADRTQDIRLEAFLSDWLVRNVPHRKSGSVNAVAPVQAALFLARKGDQAGLAICREYADWCLHGALKTANGGLAHVWHGGLDDYRNQLWIDTLFMAGLFMVQYGAAFGEDRILEEGLEQFRIHIRCQFDETSGLFYHGYHCIRNEWLGQHWGRGNGWAAAALADLLEVLDGREAGRIFADVFRRQMESALTYSSSRGLLRTLLDDPQAYEESTATALFAYAALKGSRLGLLEPACREWAEQAAAAVLDLVMEDGTLRMASGGTDCQTREGYLAVPYAQTQYAYGTVLLLISELLAANSPEEAIR